MIEQSFARPVVQMVCKAADKNEMRQCKHFIMGHRRVCACYMERLGLDGVCMSGKAMEEAREALRQEARNVLG